MGCLMSQDRGTSNNKITMKVLIIGGSSLLGKYLTLTNPGMDIETTWFSNYVLNQVQYHLDVSVYSQVAYVFSRAHPDIVILCSAIGSVDYAETHFQETQIVNLIGTRNVVKACRDFKAKLVYISTNAVFDGKNPPYNESAPRYPINAYGVLKKDAEDAVTESGLKWMIIRPFLLYGWPFPQGRQNWMTTIFNKILKNEEVQLVDDVYWQPTSAEDCAEAIWKLIRMEKWGEVFHVASDDRMTLYEFGQIITHNNPLIKPVSNSKFSTIAPRPQDTTFDLSKIHDLNIYLKSVRENMKGLKK